MSARPARVRATALEPPRRLLADFVPPEGVPIKFDVAGIGARLVAQIADILLTFMALVLLMVALFLSRMIPVNTIVTIGALLFFAIRVPYYTLTEIFWNGQTLGKRLSGLRVISGDGRTLSPHAVTVRNLMKEMEIFVPGTMLLAAPALDFATAIILLVWILVLLAVPLTNRHRQRLGDIMANTYVVYVPKPVLLPDLAEEGEDETQQVWTFLPHHLDHYGRYELQTLEALLQVDQSTLNRVSRERHWENLERVATTIAGRIGYEAEIKPEETADFLLAFYRTQRAYLENRKLFGDAREDKFHRERKDDAR